MAYADLHRSYAQSLTSVKNGDSYLILLSPFLHIPLYEMEYMSINYKNKTEIWRIMIKNK